MRVEHADLSLIGDRDENQDRVQVLAGERAVLLIAVDGMGGHADGAKAAQLAKRALADGSDIVELIVGEASWSATTSWC